MADRTDVLGEVTRAINESREIYDAVHQDRAMSRAIEDAQAVYKPLRDGLEAAKPLISEAVRIAAQVPESVFDKTVDRNMRSAIRIAKQQLDAVAEARRHLDLLRSSGLF